MSEPTDTVPTDSDFSDAASHPAPDALSAGLVKSISRVAALAAGAALRTTSG